jgi:hypothetical protein
VQATFDFLAIAGMSRTPARIRQSEIARAARVAQQLGPGYCIEVIPESGVIRIIPYSAPSAPANDPPDIEADEGIEL